MDLSPLDQHGALRQPTRARLFELLTELGRPASTDELALLVRLHPNGVRIHLEQLHEAGLLVRQRAPQGRGRPRAEWSVSPTAEPAGAPPQAYGELASWLASAIPARPGRLREIENAGRQIGQDLAPRDAPSAEAALQATLTGLGFQPEMERQAAGTATCRLRNCPYREAVKKNRQVVCTLHRGLTRGVLDVIEPAARLVAFTPKDPDRAGCEIAVEGLFSDPQQ
jgi:predicted ArsR family transcriptional regulator